jgi:hypothetical protein
MAISVVQSKAVNNSGSGATVSQTYTSTPTSGNTLVVITGLGVASGSPTCTVTSTGHTWTQDATQASGDVIVWIHRATSIGTNPTITSTLSGSQQWLAQIVIELSGVLTSSSPLDKSAGGAGTSNAPLTGTTATTSQADEIVIVGMTNTSGDNPESVTAGSGYTKTAEMNNGSVQTCYGEYKILSATGAQQAGFSTADSPRWAIVLVTYKADTGGAAATSPPPFPPPPMHLLAR